MFSTVKMWKIVVTIISLMIFSVEVQSSMMTPGLWDHFNNPLPFNSYEDWHHEEGADLTNLMTVIQNNRNWVKEKKAEKKDFFDEHKDGQSPSFLWVGCSDSRVPPNEILGLELGELFVLRNVANIVSPSDIGSLAVIQYTVEVLKVTDIIIAGHYGCGGVKAAMTKFDHGPLEAWLSQLRKIRHKNAKFLEKYTTQKEQFKKMVELNVAEQVHNVAGTPFVQRVWKAKQELRVHGVVYDMETGKLIDLGLTMHKLDQVPEQLRVV